jgi:hypothetical protein
MRTIGQLRCVAICALLFLLLGACGHGTYTQTFVNREDSSKSLSLTSSVGFVRPASNFPHNVLFKVFGTDKLEGTYVLMNGDQKVAGKFTAGKDGETQWIKFTSDEKPEWQVKVVGGELVEPDSTKWTPQTLKAESKALVKVGFGE